jgi:hypothetical protein
MSISHHRYVALYFFIKLTIVRPSRLLIEQRSLKRYGSYCLIFAHILFPCWRELNKNKMSLRVSGKRLSMIYLCSSRLMIANLIIRIMDSTYLIKLLEKSFMIFLSKIIAIRSFTKSFAYPTKIK